MVTGDMINVSKKLELVTTSSTETEVALPREMFPKCGWFHFFRLARRYSVKEDLLIQDNDSCMALHKHHPFSIGR